MADIKQQDIFNTFLKILEGTSEIQVPNDIDFDTNIATAYYYMSLDSLDAVEIIMKLEKHYGISIPDTAADVYTNKTFGEFCNLVYRCINSQKQPKQSVSLFQKIKQHFQRTK